MKPREVVTAEDVFVILRERYGLRIAAAAVMHAFQKFTGMCEALGDPPPTFNDFSDFVSYLATEGEARAVAELFGK